MAEPVASNGPQPVTDPTLLQQLNAPEPAPAAPAAPQPVTDPALLEQLNAPEGREATLEAPAGAAPASPAAAPGQPGAAAPGQPAAGDDWMHFHGIPLKVKVDPQRPDFHETVQYAMSAAAKNPMIYLNPMAVIGTALKSQGIDAEWDPQWFKDIGSGLLDSAKNFAKLPETTYRMAQQPPEARSQQDIDSVGQAVLDTGAAALGAPEIPEAALARQTLTKEPGVAARILSPQKDAAQQVRDAARKDLGGVPDSTEPYNPGGEAAGQRAMPPPVPQGKPGTYVPVEPDSTPPLTPQQLSGIQTARAKAAGGQDLALTDTGGQASTSLLRDATNVSDQAHNEAVNLVKPRYEQQTHRVLDWLQDNMGAGSESYEMLKGLKEEADAARSPAYKAAYAEGDKPLWTPRLEQLAGSPDVVDAMRAAARNGKSRAILEGMGAFNPGVSVSDTGIVTFNKGPTGVPTYPNLQFWDYTKRDLDAAAGRAFRQGDNEAGARLSQLSQQLRNELDTQVGSYKRARGVVAEFKGASDATEAGQNAYSSNNMSGAEISDLKKQMNPSEQKLFEQGYLSSLQRDVKELPDSRDIVKNMINSPGERERMEAVLGSAKSAHFGSMINVERLVNQAYEKLGNSTTTRQLEGTKKLKALGGDAAYSGMAYGAAALLGGGPTAWVTAALVFGARQGARWRSERVANEIARMLTSNDTSVYMRGVRQVSEPRYQQAIRAFSAAGDAEQTKALTTLATDAQMNAHKYTTEAPDGNHYVPDPDRPGKYLQVHH